MSDYIIVKNKAGIVIAYGANDGNYEPALASGETSSIVTQELAEPLIAALHTKLATEVRAVETQKAAILTKLGITADELRIALS